jgi:hypothetical protein
MGNATEKSRSNDNVTDRVNVSHVPLVQAPIVHPRAIIPVPPVHRLAPFVRSKRPVQLQLRWRRRQLHTRRNARSDGITGRLGLRALN